MSKTAGHKDPSFEADAVPTSNNFSQSSEKSESASVNWSNTGSPFGSLNVNINNVTGKVFTGSTFTMNCYGQGGSMFNDVIYATPYSSSSSDDNSDDTEEKEDAKKVDENILRSTISISRDNKYAVVSDIGNEYLKLARRLKGLDLTTRQIKTIMNENARFGEDEGVYTILEKWAEVSPEDATVGNLAQALVEIDRADLANKLSLDEKHELKEDMKNLHL